MAIISLLTALHFVPLGLTARVVIAMEALLVIAIFLRSASALRPGQRWVGKLPRLSTAYLVCAPTVIGLCSGEFNTYQFLRITPWILLGLVAVPVGAYLRALDRRRLLQNVMAVGILTSALFVLMERGHGVELVNALIRVEQDTGPVRLYTAFHLSLFPLALWFLRHGRYAATLAAIALILSSGGRGALLMITVMLATSILTGRRTWIGSVVAALVAVTTIAFSLDIVARIGDVELLAGDSRFREMADAYSAWSGSAWSLILGIGYGTPYSGGYAQYFPWMSDSWVAGSPVMLNSMYDLHNGFGLVLLRGGVLGLLAYLFWVWRVQQPLSEGTAFASFLVLAHFTSHALLSTPDGVLALVMWGYLFWRGQQAGHKPIRRAGTTGARPPSTVQPAGSHS